MESLPIPPEGLRERVTTRSDLVTFAANGNEHMSAIADALRRAGRPLGEFASVLDFGCGCGRLTRWFPQWLRADARMHGCDADAEAVAWCAGNLPFAAFAPNGPLPPLPYGAGAFDLVLAVSVFTHINESAGLLWMRELRRVIEPGGVAVVTLRGNAYRDELSAEEAAVVDSAGIVFVESPFWDGRFPAWYNTTHHTRAYAEATFGQQFDVLSYASEALGRQDMIVLRRPDTAPSQQEPDDATLRARWNAEYIATMQRKIAFLTGENHALRAELEKAASYARDLERRLTP
jgi:SAM-dependent methyltransferase